MFPRPWALVITALYLVNPIAAQPLDGKVTSAYYNRAECWKCKGDFERALQDADQAIRCNPTDPWKFYRRAAILARSGKNKLAIESLGKSFELGFQDFAGLAHDHDFDGIRNDLDYFRLFRPVKAGGSQGE